MSTWTTNEVELTEEEIKEQKFINYLGNQFGLDNIVRDKFILENNQEIKFYVANNFKERWYSFLCGDITKFKSVKTKDGRKMILFKPNDFIEIWLPEWKVIDVKKGKHHFLMFSIYYDWNDVLNNFAKRDKANIVKLHQLAKTEPTTIMVLNDENIVEVDIFRSCNWRAVKDIVEYTDNNIAKKSY